MLKKDNRLTKKKDFDAVWQSGRSSFDNLIGIKALINRQETNRFGIMVGLKVSKKAVERNRIKRIIRGIIETELNNLKAGFDFVIIALPSSKNAETAVLQKSLKNNFKKLNAFL